MVDSTATGDVRLVVDVFRDGWVKVPVPAGLLVRDVRVDGRLVSLIDGDRGSDGPYVLVSKRGRSTLTLDVVVAVTSNSGVETLALPTSHAPVQQVVARVPGPDADVVVRGGLVTERRTAGTDTHVTAHGRPGVALSLHWGRTREPERNTQPLRLRASTVQVVGLGEDAAQVTATITADAVQGQADRIDVAVPGGFVVNQVAGALVADWEQQDQQVHIVLLEGLTQATTFTVTGEMRLARDGQIQVPLLHVRDAEREGGGVAVEVLGAGEITAHSARGLDPADPSDLGQAVAARQSPALAAFRARAADRASDRALTVTVVRYTPQAVLLANIETARYRALLTEDGKTLIEGTYTIRNSQRSFLGVTIPAGATLWSAAVDGRPVRPGEGPNASLLLPILHGRSSAASRVTVRVLYLARGAAWSESGPVSLRLPAVDLPTSRTRVTVFHSPRYRVTLEPGAFRPAPPDDAMPLESPVEVAPRVPGAQADADVRDLITQFRNVGRGATRGTVPVAVDFPLVGEALALTTELTPEAQSPDVRFIVKRGGK